MDTPSKIKNIRETLGISRTELARKSGISLSFLNEIERGIKSPTEITLRKLCNALGISLSEFFSDHPPALPPEIRQIVNKLQKLPSDKLKVLNDVLDTWVNSEH